MTVFNPENNEKFRAATKSQLWLSHTKKRCFCGKVISSRQQAQYGCCDACYKKSKEAVEAA